ncbi:MAG TPA: 50S ribosomal protein L17 [Candidatus Dojkabacteria bacterium]|jgi:large subunit ribosomal protein L17
MNKKKSNLKLGVRQSHSKAMLRSLAISLLEKESIKTTKPRAKAVSSFVERLITKGKKQNLPSNRLIFDRLRNSSATKKLIEKIVPRFSDRNSGFIRINRTLNAPGNNAEMFVVSFVDYKPSEKSRISRRRKTEEKKEESGEGEKKGIINRITGRGRAGDKKSQVATSANQSKAKSRSGI